MPYKASVASMRSKFPIKRHVPMKLDPKIGKKVFGAVISVIPSACVLWCNVTPVSLPQSPAPSLVVCADLLVAPSRHELGSS